VPNNLFTVQLLDLIISQEYDEKTGVFVVMEYMESDLKLLLESTNEFKLTEDEVLALAYNLLQAIKFIHSANVMHRDIKPANILINNQCNVKICDFGLARSLP